MLRPHVRNARTALLGLLLILSLAACGNDNNEASDRSFAPEAQGDTVLPTNTLAPTSTPPPLNRQPGESSTSESGSSALFKSTGSAKFIASGLIDYALVDLATGDSRDPGVSRSAARLASISPDGSRVLVIDRSEGNIVVRLLAGDGSLTKEWTPAQSATPVASPVASADSIRSGDLISWRNEKSEAVVAISGLGLFLADDSLAMTPLAGFAGMAVTSVAWSPSGQSIVAGVWDQERRQAVLITASPSQPAVPGITVLSMPDSDGRFVRSLAWGSERVGIVFALRSASSDFSLPNDLYYLPKFGEPMRLLASAGLAAPAAVVDQVAIAANGSTIAFTVQIPSGSGLRFHSVWVTDALAPAPAQADTTGLRRVTDIQWSARGLVVSGSRREQTDSAVFQVAVVELLSEAEPTQVAAIRSDATPIASPIASPMSGTLTGAP